MATSTNDANGNGAELLLTDNTITTQNATDKLTSNDVISKQVAFAIKGRSVVV